MRNIILVWLCMYCSSCIDPQAPSHGPKKPVRLQMDDENADSMDLANRLALDALGFYELYEDAKWRIYCIHCDDTVKYDSLAIHKTYGQLKCNLSRISFSEVPYYDAGIMEGKIELYFEFVYDFPHAPVKSFGNIKGCLYWMNTKKFYCYMDGTVTPFIIPNCPPNAPDRICNPLQPEVVKYIIANQKVIDPWFYLKAKEKGVFWK